jgi:hypothetical protein
MSFVLVTSAGWHICNLFSVQTSLEQVALSSYTSVGFGDFKTVTLLSAIGSTVAQPEWHLGAEWEALCTNKWCLVFPSFFSYHE